MTWMISLTSQILDQVRDLRQRPQVGLKAALNRNSDQCCRDCGPLPGGEPGFPAGNSTALEPFGALVMPSFVPIVAVPPANPQSSSDFRWVDSLFEQFGGSKAALLHGHVIALLPHAARARILHAEREEAA